MVNIILLRNFNNYFNRKFKRVTTISDLKENYEYREFTVDFNPNDGIETKHVINWQDSWTPDYMVVQERPEGGLVLNIPTSKWFVTEAVRTRGKQFEISLKRDVVSDFIDFIGDSPAFIDKGTITDTQSPLLFNNEQVSVNQIKTGQLQLFDNSRCPWLVMYLKKEALGNDREITFNIEQNPQNVIAINSSFSNWKFHQFNVDNHFIGGGQPSLQFNCTVTRPDFILGTVRDSQRLTIRQDGSNQIDYFGGNLENNLVLAYPRTIDTLNRAIHQGTTLNNLFDALANANIVGTNSDVEEFRSFNGKIIKDTLNKFYKITVIERNVIKEQYITRNGNTASLHSEMQTIWNSTYETSTIANDKSFYVIYDSVSDMYFSAVEVTEAFAATCNLNQAGEFTENPLFDIICLPYGNITMRVGGGTVTTTKEQSLALMNQLARNLADNVIDLQLLPYCPIQQYLVNGEIIGTGSADYIEVDNAGDLPIAYFLVVKSDTFTFDIEREVHIPQQYLDKAPICNIMKLVNDCTMMRLVSPNYNGAFDFNLAKNGGIVTYFNVDCTYKPFNPYIHVNPNFNRLYGQDYNDARGLICGGDFSIGTLKDAFQQYEIQNRNYQAIFDRQIQNLDFNNKIAKQEAAFGLVAGVGTGAIGGAIAGSTVGGPWGAAIGGVAGAGLSAIGGAMDYSNLSARQREARQMSIDMFNLQLGNVKALPLSITKTSPITANNLLVPTLEVYECTEAEIDAYLNKLQYDGMSIGIIDKLSNWTSEGSYLKCRLIRVVPGEELASGMSEDTHLFNALYEELSKGVYF